ncbi:hypothetical protein [Paenibacillus bouchesdurhonensis]|uniref:hypothetical protein n=1 Tax=Paenibacillus bouchesdurhonensis TaxID=1870990 RepID=UPI0018FF2E50|nr:hypothetical protein [Paenibacillus bouchesdurhonensis]
MARNKKSQRQDIELADLTADDLALIASGLNVLSNLFTIWSLLKVREEAENLPND